ncbi:hypothetical protein [Lysobacter auxotrophicus]|uniref:Protein sip-5 n=1 Tax=Lysobacter auxotrophicus TaxID=2992573 RepID=A0ABN6UG70_9GAMM|nr:hypothetical protein [Lysobacter auxotrophicus]BDU15301.1 hypothetical protein LA521A_05020 [Lysobacter auxotrophicus]
MAIKQKKPTFKQLIAKVHQAEDVVETREREVVADIRHLKSSWLAAWTPWRIVTAGLAAGFLVGRAEPMKAVGKSGGLLQMISMVSTLVASGSAKVAAEEASEVSEQVASGENLTVADALAARGAVGAGVAPVGSVHPDAVADDFEDEAYALAQAETRARAARTATVDQVGP